MTEELPEAKGWEQPSKTYNKADHPYENDLRFAKDRTSPADKDGGYYADWKRPEDFILSVDIKGVEFLCRTNANGYNVFVTAEAVCKIFNLGDSKRSRQLLEKVGLNLYKHPTCQEILVRLRDVVNWYNRVSFMFKPKDLSELEYLCEKLGYELKRKQSDGSADSVSIDRGYTDLSKGDNRTRKRRQDKQQRSEDPALRSQSAA